MKIRIATTTFAMVASALVLTSTALTPSAFAAPVSFHAPMHAAFTASTAKPKMVTVNLRNDSTEPITLKAGEESLTLAPGKVTPVKVAVGTRLIADNTTPHYTPGTIIAVVDQQLDKATLSFK